MRISVDYDEVYQASIFVKRRSETYNELILNLYSRMQEMQGIWNGIDHVAFIEELEQFRPSLNELKEVIDQYALVLENTSKAYEELQLERVEMAKRLL